MRTAEMIMWAYDMWHMTGPYGRISIWMDASRSRAGAPQLDPYFIRISPVPSLIRSIHFTLYNLRICCALPFISYLHFLCLLAEVFVTIWAAEPSISWTLPRPLALITATAHRPFVIPALLSAHRLPHRRATKSTQSH